MTRQMFWKLVKRYTLAAGVRGALSPHTLRACIRDPPAEPWRRPARRAEMLLGHSDLSTTQIYTHVARERMKELHA